MVITPFGLREDALIECDLVGSVAWVTMNRPDMHNAFNDQMLQDLIWLFEKLATTKYKIRVVVLTGKGKSFCAGADLEWMRNEGELTKHTALERATLIADCMYALYTLPQPTIARVNGNAFGGGIGLVAASDIAIAVSTAKFKCSEVYLGLVPACIARYVMMRIGYPRCKELFLTGQKLSADEAVKYCLINEAVSPDELDDVVNLFIEQLKLGGSEALRTCKEVIGFVANNPAAAEEKQYITGTLAEAILSKEGQEGMKVFLEKRKPDWVK